MANSQIFTQMPSRLITQNLNKTKLNYKLGNLMGSTTEVALGQTEEIYRLRRKMENPVRKGYEAMTLDDVNKGTSPAFSHVVKADQPLSAGYDVPSVMLNDFAIKTSLFKAIAEDYAMEIGDRFSLEMYKRFITFINNRDNYDKTLDLTRTDVDNVSVAELKDEFVKILNYFRELEILSTDHLAKFKTKFADEISAAQANDATKNGEVYDGLLYSLPDLSTVDLVIDSKFASTFRVDLQANTFNIGEVSFQAKSIQVADMEKLSTWSGTVANGKKVLKSEVIRTKKRLPILIGLQSGVYKSIIHYTGQTSFNTSRLYSSINRYDMINDYRKYDKIAFVITAKTK